MSKITTTPYPTSARSLLLVLKNACNRYPSPPCARGCSIQGVYYPGCRRSSPLTNETKINRFIPQPRPTRVAVLTSAVISAVGDCYASHLAFYESSVDLKWAIGSNLIGIGDGVTMVERVDCSLDASSESNSCCESVAFFCHARSVTRRSREEGGSLRETFDRMKFQVLELLSRCQVGQWEIPKMWFIACSGTDWQNKWQKGERWFNRAPACFSSIFFTILNPFARKLLN